MITIIDAILEIAVKAQVSVVGENIDTAVLTWSSSEISRADIKTKMTELQTTYNNNKYYINNTGIVGNLFEQSLEEIYNSDGWNKVVDEHKQDKYTGICENCTETW